MFAANIRRFARRLLSVALVATVAGALDATALVGCFAGDLVAYFINSSNAATRRQAEFRQEPIDSALGTLGNLELGQ